MSHFENIWSESPDGRALCALIAGEVGWLMYVPEPGDAGFRSHNPDYVGSLDATIDYVLNNGQRDSYPASWALPLPIVERAIAQFRATGRAAPFIDWIDESGEGRAPL